MTGLDSKLDSLRPSTASGQVSSQAEAVVDLDLTAGDFSGSVNRGKGHAIADNSDHRAMPHEARPHHGARKCHSEGAVSRVVSGYATLTRPTAEAMERRNDI